MMRKKGITNIFVQTGLVVAVLSGATLAAVACSKDTSINQNNETKITAITEVIGPTGGMLLHPLGAVVEIPMGAMAQEVQLTLRNTEASEPPSAPVNMTVEGQYYAVEPHGQSFAMPITVRLSREQSNATIYRAQPDGPWEPMPTAGDGVYWVTETDSFSYYAVFTGQGTGGVDGGSLIFDDASDRDDASSPTDASFQTDDASVQTDDASSAMPPQPLFDQACLDGCLSASCDLELNECYNDGQCLDCVNSGLCPETGMNPYLDDLVSCACNVCPTECCAG